MTLSSPADVLRPTEKVSSVTRCALKNRPDRIRIPTQGIIDPVEAPAPESTAMDKTDLIKQKYRHIWKAQIDTENALRAMREEGASPYDCMTALRVFMGMPRADAKSTVHHSGAWADMKDIEGPRDSLLEALDEDNKAVY